MLKVNFENGVKTQEAKVTIDGTDYEVTPAVWSGTTPLSAYNLNKMQDNIEEEVNITQETQEASSVEITNVAPVNGKIDVSGNSVQKTDINLPEEYQQVEYIESNGTQGISTGISGNGTWEIRVQGTATSSNTQIIIGRSDSKGHWMGIAGNATKYGLGGGINSSTNYNELIDATIVTTNSGISLTIGSETITRNNDLDGPIANNYTIGNLRSYQASMKLYKAKFYQDNTLVRDFIPCYRKSDNEIGLYDLVNNTFYTNNGTGTFLKGDIPSPTYPIEIHNVGDNVNLLPYPYSETTKTSNGITYTDNGDGSITINGTATSQSYFNFWLINTNTMLLTDRSKTYSILKGITNNNLEIRALEWYDGSWHTVSSSSSNYGTLYNISENAVGQGFRVVISSGVTINNVTIYPMIVEGDYTTIAYPYSPYNCGNTNIRVSNKNLFDVEFLRGYWNSNGTYNAQSSTSTTMSTPKFKLKAGTYVISNSKITKLQWYIIKWINDVYNAVSMHQTKTFTLDEDTIISFQFNDPKGSGVAVEPYLEELTEYMMLEKGTTATSYVPHQEQLITFPFTEGQRLYEGDYLASDGIHHVGGPKIFDGSEDERWYYSDSLEAFYNIDLSDAKLGSEYLCNSFIKINNSTGFAYMHSGETRYGSSSDNRIYFKYTDYSTVEDFKTWMANNPIKVQYIFKEEIIEPYTEEQEEAYWQLQHALMYEKYTKVECIDETKAKFVVTYSYNNDINLTYGKRIDDLEYKIHQLENIVNNLS